METAPRPQSQPKSGKSNLKLAAGLVVLAALFGIGLAPKVKNDETLKERVNAASSAEPSVEVVAPKLAAADSLLLPGTIQAIASAAVQARTSGYIEKVYVDIGSHVKAGQVLADIQSPDVDQQYAQAQSDTAKSRATVGQSMADVARLRAGVAQSQADLVRQEAGIYAAKAALAGTRSKYEQAKSAESSAEAKLAQAKAQEQAQEATLAQYQAQYDLAVSTEKRYRGLLAEGFVAQQDYDTALAGLKSAKATLDATRAGVQSAKSVVNSAAQDVAASKSAVESASSDTEAAKANVRASQASYNSSAAVVEAARESVEAGASTVDANRAAVGSSEANARLYGVLRNFQHVVAPFDGVITSRNVDEGALVTPGTISSNTTGSAPNTGLFGIARTDSFRIYLSVPQSSFRWVQAGDRIQVLVRELPNDKFIGTVYRTAGAIDQTTRTMLVEIRLPNENNKLVPGMYAQVKIDPPADAKAIRVPSGALQIDASGTRVIVVDADGTIHYKKVVLGKDYGTEVEVLSGISLTDRLANNPPDGLADGEKVEVVTGSGN
jgi:RND family efflux transporter MFP subunit